MTADTVTIEIPGSPPVTMTGKEFNELPGKISRGIKNGTIKRPAAKEPEAGKQDAPKTGTEAKATGEAAENTAAKRLKSFIERIERVEGEISSLQEDVKEIYAESKGTGFEPRVMRRIIKLRKMDIQKRKEEEEIEHLYRSALGME